MEASRRVINHVVKEAGRIEARHLNRLFFPDWRFLPLAQVF